MRESVEILAFQTPGGQIIRLLPMALATVIEETPGVERFQAIQTAPDQLTVRLQATGDAEVVWMAVRRRVQAYLASQGLATVAVEGCGRAASTQPKERQVPPYLGRVAGAGAEPCAMRQSGRDSA